MNFTPLHIRSAIIALFVLMVAVFSVGCFTRGPNSPYIAPPEDPIFEENAPRLERLLRSAELQLATADDYYIGPGDLISIALVGRPDVLGVNKEDGERLRIRISENPLITLPFIGAIKVHGKTSTELQEDLRVAFAEYITEPAPIVTIEEYRYNRVTVLGSIKSPGRYVLEPGMTLMEAVYVSGGFTYGRDTGGPPPARYLKVFRDKVTPKQKADLPLEELLALLREDQRIAPREEIIVPIDQFINQGQLQYNIPLMPNDIIYIPPAGTVIVQGYLVSPGVVFLGPSLRTLTHVVTDRGGLRYGSDSRVEVVRTLPDGSQISQFFDIRDMFDRDVSDFLLQDGDQVFVYTNPWRYTLEWFGNLFSGSIRAGASATYNPIG